jgi:hypothetical protein
MKKAIDIARKHYNKIEILADIDNIIKKEEDFFNNIGYDFSKESLSNKICFNEIADMVFDNKYNTNDILKRIDETNIDYDNGAPSERKEKLNIIFSKKAAEYSLTEIPNCQTIDDIKQKLINVGFVYSEEYNGELYDICFKKPNYNFEETAFVVRAKLTDEQWNIDYLKDKIANILKTYIAYLEER